MKCKRFSLFAAHFCHLTLHLSLNQAISQYLPRGDLRLRPAIYEMILHDFLKTDYEVLCHLSFLTSCLKSLGLPIVLFTLLSTKGFATLIREWPGELYNNMAIVQAVSDHLKRDPTNSILLTTLAEL